MEHELLGKEVKDIITEFSGVAIGVTSWITGCTTVGIQPKELKEGKRIDVEWFDENRIDVVGPGVSREIVDGIRIAQKTAKTRAESGGPQPTPGDGRSHPRG